MPALARWTKRYGLGALLGHASSCLMCAGRKDGPSRVNPCGRPPLFHATRHSGVLSTAIRQLLLRLKGAAPRGRFPVGVTPVTSPCEAGAGASGVAVVGATRRARVARRADPRVLGDAR